MELKKTEEQRLKGNDKGENPSGINLNENNSNQETIIDLVLLSNKSEIKNSDIILSILEICTFNKKYNYDCSNNTKAFWDRVAEEEILKKIFKNFKGETLRKYWKVIRSAGNNSKYISVVKQNEAFINNPNFKLLRIINAIASFIQKEEKDFKTFFTNFHSKDKNDSIKKNDLNENENKKSIICIGNKRKINCKDNYISQPNNMNKSESNKAEDIKAEDKKEETYLKIIQSDNSINKLLEITKLTWDEVAHALCEANRIEPL
jgi:hypothetical protein